MIHKKQCLYQGGTCHLDATQLVTFRDLSIADPQLRRFCATAVSLCDGHLRLLEAQSNHDHFESSPLSLISPIVTTCDLIAFHLGCNEKQVN